MPEKNITIPLEKIQEGKSIGTKQRTYFSYSKSIVCCGMMLNENKVTTSHTKFDTLAILNQTNQFLYKILFGYEFFLILIYSDNASFMFLCKIH